MIDRPTWTILDEASFASVRVDIPPNKQIQCEPDAIVSMSDHPDDGGLEVSGHLDGGLWESLTRWFLTNKSFFVSSVRNTSLEQVADVLLAHPAVDCGGIVLHDLSGGVSDELLMDKGAYLAADETVNLSTSIQFGFSRPILSETGFFILKASGRGTLALSSNGAIHRYHLQSGERRIVDNGHLVAWTSRMKYEVKCLRRTGIFGSITSGEGFMCFFEGPGIIYVRSHRSRVARTNDEQSRGTSSSLLRGMIAFAFFSAIMALFFMLGYLSLMKPAEPSFTDNRYGYRKSWNSEM